MAAVHYYVIETDANLVKEGCKIKQHKIIAAAGISDPRDLPRNLILHVIHMHGLRRMPS